jgi:hypothetical protein
MALKSAFRGVLTIEEVRGSGVFTPWPPNASEAKYAGMWDAFSGGKLTMKETKYTPYDEQQRVYAGIKETENYTLEIDYDIDLHGPVISKWATEGDPRGRKCKLIVLERDTGGNFQQNRPPVEGQVLEVAYPDGDSNDASNVDKITFIVSVGIPAGQGE